MNEFNLSNNSNHNVRLVAEKDAICIKHIPPDGLYDSIVVSFVDDMGHRLDIHPINKANDSFLIQLQYIHPGRYFQYGRNHLVITSCGSGTCSSNTLCYKEKDRRKR